MKSSRNIWTNTATRRFGGACALVLSIGISTVAFAQVRLLGETGGDWTVLTMAPDGAWGAATDDYVNRAIAGSLERCRAMSGRMLGCGAYFVSV